MPPLGNISSLWNPLTSTIITSSILMFMAVSQPSPSSTLRVKSLLRQLVMPPLKLRQTLVISPLTVPKMRSIVFAKLMLLPTRTIAI